MKKKNQKTYLYRHFDSDGVLLYIGISCSAIQRLSNHMAMSHWSARIAQVKIQVYPSREEAILAEASAIKEENPIHNIIHKKGSNNNDESREEKRKLSRFILTQNVVFKPIYTIRDAAELLNMTQPALKKAIEDNLLGHIVLPTVKSRWKPEGGDKKLITGWQLLDYIEYLEKNMTIER